MSGRLYTLCEGKRDKFFLARLLRERLGTETRLYDMKDLDELIRNQRFSGVAIVDCGGWNEMLKQASKRARDITVNPSELPSATLIIIGDEDHVSVFNFANHYLRNEIERLKSTSKFLEYEIENEMVMVKNLRRAVNTKVVVLTIPNNLESQISNSIKNHNQGFREYGDKRVINLYCEELYGCDEERMMKEDREVIPPLFDTEWSKNIVKHVN